jgi:hypothetical protein
MAQHPAIMAQTVAALKNRDLRDRDA